MSLLLNRLTHVYMSPAGEANGGGGGGAAPDRGDHFEPTPPIVEPAGEAEGEAAAAQLEAELTDKKPADETPPDEKHTDEKRKDTRIPLERHEAVLNKEREKSAALAAENAMLKQFKQLESTSVDAQAEFDAIETQITGLETQYAELMAEGELKQAATLMAQIRQAERYVVEKKADLKIQAATVQATESARYTAALGRIEAAYPTLNPDHESYDKDTETRVAKIARMNQADGMSMTAALQDAVETLLGATTARQEQATTVTPRVGEKDIAAERKKLAMGKTVKAVESTPASLGKSGLDSDKMGGGAKSAAAVIALSANEFAKLSEAALSELRGDNL